MFANRKLKNPRSPPAAATAAAATTTPYNNSRYHHHHQQQQQQQQQQRNNSAGRIVIKENEMKPQHHFRRRRRAPAGFSTLVGAGGRGSSSRLSVMIMGGTVGALMFLLLVQSSYFWPTSALFFGKHNDNNNNNNKKASIIKSTIDYELLDKTRKAFLETIRKRNNENLCARFPATSTTTTLAKMMMMMTTTTTRSASATAQKLWTQHIGAILTASQHPDDPHFIHQEWTKRLLSEIPPSLLQQTLLQRGNNNNNNQHQHQHQHQHQMDRILEIIRRRLVDPDTNPPLRIAVVGGTFSEGEGCSVASVAVPEGSIMANPTFCAWPYRLQGFLNSLVYGNNNNNNNKNKSNASATTSTPTTWVEVINLSEEGTDTGFMTPLMGNWVYPKSLLPHGPDIIINAYTQYDYETYGEGKPTDLQQVIQAELQAFFDAVQESYKSPPCGASSATPPLMIYMSDFTDNINNRGLGGNKKREEEQFNGGGLGENVTVIHYWEAFRHAMQADHHDPKDLAMAGHMAMTWVLAFDFLQLALQHCSAAKNKVVVPLPPPPSQDHCDHAVSTTTTAKSRSSSSSNKCSFAFFAGPQGTVSKVLDMQKYINPFVFMNQGWQVLTDMSTGWSRRTGLVAVEPNARIIFSVPNITRQVRYLHLMTLKSSESQWKQGKTRFQLIIFPNGEQAGDQQEAVQTSFDIEAAHDKEGHITYHMSIEFHEASIAKVGSDLKLSMELIEGNMFKVLGLMLCS